MPSMTITNMYKYILWISIIASVHCAGTTCKDGWMAYRGSCYQFPVEQKLNFVEAQHYCEQHHATLVEIDNAHENNFLVDFVKHQPEASWWIGLTDQDIEGEYKWVGSDNFATYTNWDAGQPGNDVGGNEDCVELLSGFNYSWHDVVCSAQSPPICEMPSLECGGDAVVG